MYTQQLLRRIPRVFPGRRHRHGFSSHQQLSMLRNEHQNFFSTSGQSQTHQGIRILYASQTGTAQLFAHQLAEGLEDEGIENVSVLGVDEAPVNELLSPGHLHLLLASCTGAGEPPDHSREFYKWIMENSETASLPGDVSYAVFGLGNQMAHPNNYNVIGKQLDARLEELGAKRVREIGLGDDGGCIDDDFDKWMEDISTWIKTSSSASSLEEVKQESTSSAKEMVEEKVRSGVDNTAEVPQQTRLVDSKKRPTVILDSPTHSAVSRDLFHLTGENQFYTEETAKLKVISNRLLTPDGGESALHEIRVSLNKDNASNEGSSKDLTYTTGDHLVVYPRNSDAIVRAYIDLLDVDPYAIISETNNSESYPFPRGITLSDTLSHCIDLGAQPTPSLSRMILGRKDIDYVNEIANPRRTIIDLCYEANAKLSLEDFLYHAVPMKPRYYSIASSSMKSPTEIHLVFRPVHYMTSKGYLREGVCTSFMCHKGAFQMRGKQGDLDSNAYLPAAISPNPSFRLPKDPQTPLLLIGGGCGVAPLRAFIEERIMLAKHNVALGPATLFMGFRNPQDEVYHGLVKKALEVGALTESDVVFDTGCSNQRLQMFVSDLVHMKGDKVWEFLQSGGHLYMCGGAVTFGRAVENALGDIIQTRGNMDFDAAVNYIKSLMNAGRFAEDIAN